MVLLITQPWSRKEFGKPGATVNELLKGISRLLIQLSLLNFYSFFTQTRCRMLSVSFLY